MAFKKKMKLKFNKYQPILKVVFGIKCLVSKMK